MERDACDFGGTGAERVGDGIRDRRGSRDGGAFTRSFDPERVEW